MAISSHTWLQLLSSIASGIIRLPLPGSLLSALVWFVLSILLPGKSVICMMSRSLEKVVPPEGTVQAGNGRKEALERKWV